MDKKILIVVSTVLVFFAGSIWADQVPTVTSLVAFLEAAAGFGLGYLFNRELNKKNILSYEKEIKSLKDAQKALLEEKKIKIAAPKRTAKKTEK